MNSSIANCQLPIGNCRLQSARHPVLQFAICILQFAFCTSPLCLLAQDPPPPANKPTLAGDQDAIRARYRRFSLTLQQMAEILRKQDPERADLLFRAIGRSQESRVEDQMALIFQLLNREQPQLGEAIERQDELVVQLKALLDLMQSEDRRSEIEKEKQRLQELLKDINKLIGKEKDVRAGTERGDDTKKLADKQGDVDKQAGDLEKKIDKQDAEKNGESSKPADKSAKSSDKSKGSDQKSDEQDDKPSDDQKNDDRKKPDDKENNPNDKPADDNKRDESLKPADKNSPGKSSPKQSESKSGSKPSQPMPSDKNQKSQGKPSDNDQQQQQEKQNDKPSDSESAPQSPDQKQLKTPGRKELEQSRDAMQRAIEELKKQQRDNASKEQDEAIRKLMEAKGKIEEILRQLREEEQKLLLAALEARFKKMLVMQLIIYHDTVRLSKAGESEKSSVQARSVKLAQDEQEILVETDKALVLLKEEGSSVAFPESIVAIRQDVQSLVKWLRDAQVGELTQAVEKDVIEALEELIEALQKEMEKSDEEKKQQPQQQQQSSDQIQPLVDQLAELKMLRSLQFRVNRRTKQLGRQVDGEQATKPDVVEQLQDLSGRQSRIQQATTDLVKGKNK